MFGESINFWLSWLVGSHTTGRAGLIPTPTHVTLFLLLPAPAVFIALGIGIIIAVILAPYCPPFLRIVLVKLKQRFILSIILKYGWLSPGRG